MVVMKLLSKIIPENNVLLGLSVTSKKRALEQASLLFENNQGLERAAVFDSLFARERLGSTGLGEGVAVPHGRIKGISQAVAAFIRLAEPIAFDAPDGKPVSMMVFLLVPEAATQQHLDILAEIAQLLSSASVREQLASELDPAVIHRILCSEASDLPSGATQP